MSAIRTIILEPDRGERGLEPPVAEAMRRLQDLMGVLLTVGGEFVVRADRVKIGELPGTPVPCGKCKGAGERNYGQGMEACRACSGRGAKEGPPEPISETVGFLMEWRNVVTLRDEPLTSKLMDHVLGSDGSEDDDERADEPVELALELPAEDEPVELDDDAGEEPDEED